MKITYTGRQVELAPAQLKKLEASSPRSASFWTEGGKARLT